MRIVKLYEDGIICRGEAFFMLTRHTTTENVINVAATFSPAFGQIVRTAFLEHPESVPNWAREENGFGVLCRWLASNTA
jgi:hypothetical protein